MSLTGYDLSDDTATITLDDGKVNALSTEMLAEISAALERAESEAEVVILTGARSTFSAGFDLRTEPDGWREMLAAGAGLAERLMTFPRPVVVACNGNALAMGGFVLLAADHRIGSGGDFKIGLNEVRIGMTLPWFAIEIARHRLTRPYFDRCTVTGAILGPEEARDAGFFDEVVPAEGLMDAARERAGDLKGIDQVAHAATKVRIRARALEAIRDGIDRIVNDSGEW